MTISAIYMSLWSQKNIPFVTRFSDAYQYTVLLENRFLTSDQYTKPSRPRWHSWIRSDWRSGGHEFDPC